MKLDASRAISALGALYVGIQQGKEQRRQQDQERFLEGHRLLQDLYRQQQAEQLRRAQFLQQQVQDDTLDDGTRANAYQQAQALMNEPPRFDPGPHEGLLRQYFGRDFDRVIGDFRGRVPQALAIPPAAAAVGAVPRFLSRADDDQYRATIGAFRQQLARETDPGKRAQLDRGLATLVDAARGRLPYGEWAQQNPGFGASGLALIGPSVSPDRKKRAASGIAILQKRAGALTSPEARQAWADFLETNPIPTDLETPDGLEYAEGWNQAVEGLLAGYGNLKEREADQRRAGELVKQFSDALDLLKKPGAQPADYLAAAQRAAAIRRDPLVNRYYPTAALQIPEDMLAEPLPVPRRVPARFTRVDQVLSQEQAERNRLAEQGRQPTPALEQAWLDRRYATQFLAAGNPDEGQRKKHQGRLQRANDVIARVVGKVDVPEGTSTVPAYPRGISGEERSGAAFVDRPAPIQEFEEVGGMETEAEVNARLYAAAARRAENPRDRLGMARYAAQQLIGLLRSPTFAKLDEPSRAGVLERLDAVSEEFGLPLPKFGDLKIGLSAKEQALLDHRQWEREYRNRIAAQRDRALDLRERSLEETARKVKEGAARPGGGKWTGADAAALSAARRQADQAKREWESWIGARRKKSLVDLAPGEDWHAWDPNTAAQNEYEMEHFPEHREGVRKYQAWLEAEGQYRRTVEDLTGRKLGGAAVPAETPSGKMRTLTPQQARAAFIRKMMEGDPKRGLPGVDRQTAEHQANLRDWRGRQWAAPAR